MTAQISSAIGDVEAGCGVCCCVDGSQPLDADARVALGGFEPGLAEHLGDVANVGAALEHQRCGWDALSDSLLRHSFTEDGAMGPPSKDSTRSRICLFVSGSSASVST